MTTLEDTVRKVLELREDYRETYTWVGNEDFTVGEYSIGFESKHPLGLLPKSKEYREKIINDWTKFIGTKLEEEEEKTND